MDFQHPGKVVSPLRRPEFALQLKAFKDWRPAAFFIPTGIMAISPRSNTGG